MRSNRDAPEWHDAAASYSMDGKTYAFNIVASSREDAERRLAAIKENGRIDGWPCFGMKVNHITLPLAALWLWLRSTLSGLVSRGNRL